MLDRLPERRELVARAAGVVGDDGVVHVDGVLQVPEHAIGIERRVVVGELRHPLRQPLLVRGRDLGRDRRRRRASAVTVLPISSSSASSTRPASPTRPILRVDILVEMVGIERGVDDGLALRHRDAEVGFGEGAADAEDDVGLGEEFRHRARHRETRRSRATADASPGTTILPPRLVVTGIASRSASRFNCGHGLGIVHALAGIDHGTLGIDEQRRGLLDMHGVGAVAGAQHRRVVQRLRHLLVPHVGGISTITGPPRPFFSLVKARRKMLVTSAARMIGSDDFENAFIACAGIEVRLDVRKPPRIAHRQHQHGHGLAVALRHAAHRVLGARPVLHAERADRVARGDARDRVRHVQADALLAHHDRADIGVRRVLDQVIDRIAAEDLDPLALHDFRNGGAELHGVLSPGIGRL